MSQNSSRRPPELVSMLSSPSFAFVCFLCMYLAKLVTKLCQNLAGAFEGRLQFWEARLHFWEGRLILVAVWCPFWCLFGACSNWKGRIGMK